MKHGIHFLVVLWLMGGGLPSYAEDKPTCAVLAFEAGAGLSQEEARFLHARFAALLPRYDRYQVVAESRIQDLLKVAQFNRSDFTSTMDYALEIGKILQIRYVIIGSAGRIGDLFSMNTSVVDVETGQIVQTAVTDHRGQLTEFASQAPEENIRELLFGATRGSPNARVESGTTTGAAPVVRSAPSAADRRLELQQARRLYESGLYKEAGDLLKNLMRESGPSVEAHILLGESYAKQKGWYHLAVRELEKAIALDASTVEGRLALARVHIEVGGRGDKALILLKEVEAIAPGHADLDDLASRARQLPRAGL